jgi:hypothetical protein
MFVTQNQIYFFIESLFIGVISGVGFEIVFLLKQVVSNEKIKNLPNGWVAKELKISKYGTKEVE